jgi:hypothetical protein
MCHLEASSVTPTIISMGLTNQVDRKATFSIHITGDPTDLYQPFLLIFRSCRIVTAV